MPGLADPPGSAAPAEPLENSAGFLNLVWFTDPANGAVQSRSAELAIPTFNVIRARGARRAGLLQGVEGICGSPSRDSAASPVSATSRLSPAFRG